MGAVHSSETLMGIYWTAPHYIPEDSTVQKHFKFGHEILHFSCPTDFRFKLA
jgi:hypothetical protein